VASASRTFTVGPSGAPQTDTTRGHDCAQRWVGADQHRQRHRVASAVPAGGLNIATPITIAPLTAFTDLPGGPLLAGVRAEPSGLRFNTPATLTITLPAGFQAPPFGLTGFVADSDGRNLQRVPVLLVGNVATMQVPHFSVAGIFDIEPIDYSCELAVTVQHRAACAQLEPLWDAERRRGGGPVGPSYRAAWTSILRTWLQSGILPRMTAARVPLPDRALDLVAVTEEWKAWVNWYDDLFPLLDRSNAASGQPLGADIDNLQGQYVLAVSASIDALNLQCLANKTLVTGVVRNVSLLGSDWSEQFPNSTPLPFPPKYCVDIDIQAAPLPVLTIGTPALMPLDFRMRFTDGVELVVATPLAVTITATNATVSPAGGFVTTPVVTTITVTPSATTGTMTISAAVAAAATGTLRDLNLLPGRVVTFPTGADLAFGQATLSASIDVDDTFVNIGPDPPAVFSSITGFPAQATATRSDTVPNRGYPVGGYSASGNATVTRTVTRPPGALVISYTGGVVLGIARTGMPVNESALVRSSVSDQYVANLPVPFDVVSPSCGAAMNFANPVSGLVVTLTDGVAVRLPPGAYQVRFLTGNFLEMNLFTGTTTGTPSATLACSVEFRAAP